MNKNESAIVESVRSFLGLDHHDYSKINRLDLGGQHVQSHISELFKLKAAELVHHDNIISAFNKTQSTMYLDDPAFGVTFMKEMTGRAVPKPEIMDALKFADDVLDKATKEFDSSSAKDAGWNPNLEDIKEVTQPEQNTEFKTVKPRKGHEQKSNIESDMPIDRPKPKRINESTQIDEGRRISGSTYATTIEIETADEFIAADVRISFDAQEPEPRTWDYPGSPGGISIYDFVIDSLKIYDDSSDDPVQGRLSPEEYKKMVANEIKSRESDLEEEIGIALGEHEEGLRDDYYDHKRRQQIEDRF